MDSNTENNGRLIDEARSNPAAFGRLYRRHYDAVFRYCVHRLFERQTAEDVTSAVFLKVVENFRDFNGSESRFRNWLCTVATSAVSDHLRKSARRVGLLTIARVQVNDGKHTDDEITSKTALLKQAMFALKPKYQTIITLRFFENLRLTEIAEVLSSSPGTVRSQLKRALARLRKKMAAAETADRQEV